MPRKGWQAWLLTREIDAAGGRPSVVEIPLGRKGRSPAHLAGMRKHARDVRSVLGEKVLTVVNPDMRLAGLRSIGEPYCERLGAAAAAVTSLRPGSVSGG